MNTRQHDLPLVSVVIPSHNYGRYVSQALESVQAQTHANWECLVIDDGSTDDTRSVVAVHATDDSRIRYFWQANAGPSAARNVGIANSHGEYIAFLDADDLIEPGKLAFQVDFLERHTEIDILLSDVRYFRADNPVERFHSIDGDTPWIARTGGQGPEILETLLNNNITTVNSPLLRQQLVSRVGLFDERVPGVEDYDYWIRCALLGARFQYADAEGTCALVRAHATSLSRDRRMVTESLLFMHRKVCLAVMDEHLHEINRRRIAELEGLLGLEEVARGRVRRGVLHLTKAACFEGRLRYRAKWLLCAAAAPLLHHRRLERLARTSISGSMADVLSRKGRPGRR